MLQARIIITKGGKYDQRRQYAAAELLPKLSQLYGVSVGLREGVTNDGFLLNEERNQICTSSFPFKLAYESGNIGNFLSHVRLWKDACDLGRILILEDDVELLPENAETVNQAIESWRGSPNGTILNLQSQVPYLPKDHPGRLRNYHLEEIGIPGLNQVKVPCYDLAGTAAYVIDAKAAEILLAKLPCYPLVPVDQFISRFVNLSLIKCLVPTDYQKCFTLHPELYWG